MRCSSCKPLQKPVHTAHAPGSRPIRINCTHSLDHLNCVTACCHTQTSHNPRNTISGARCRMCVPPLHKSRVLITCPIEHITYILTYIYTYNTYRCLCCVHRTVQHKHTNAREWRTCATHTHYYGATLLRDPSTLCTPPQTVNMMMGCVRLYASMGVCVPEFAG